MHRLAIGGLALALLAGAACGKSDKDKDGQPPAKPPEKPPVVERSVGVLGAGTPAPDFTATAHDGSTITLSALRGQTVVLYFYPKDETPG
jgi:cytochrome oxidase Cu insertion factor (SCO1/SenC/PrrC family)